MNFDSIQAALAAFLEGEVPGQISAWLATYLVHGVCLFAVAAVAVRFVKSARCGEQLWRAALFGPLVTASLQLGAGLQPALGHWELPGATEAVAQEPVTKVAVSLDSSEALRLREAAIVARLNELGDQLLLVTDTDPDARKRAFANAAPVTTSPANDDVRPRNLGTALGLLAVAAGIAALMMRALLEAIRIHRLGKRARLMSGPVVDSVRALSARAGIRRNIRVEVTRSGSSPYATGVLLPRIVVPERATRELDAASMRAMLAHEIGHVARFDPLWTAAARSVAALFFFQPLNWLLVKRLDESAEYCCDEFAVDVTGNEVALARCLATVAEWIIGGPAKLRPACPMAHRHSPLASRVDRILATDGEPTRPLGPLRWIGGAVVMTTALAAPGFAARAVAPEAHAPPAPVLPAESERTFAQPATVFEALSASVRHLGSEIDELIQVAAERDVPESTLQRLRVLRKRTRAVRELTLALQEKAQRLER